MFGINLQYYDKKQPSECAPDFKNILENLDISYRVTESHAQSSVKKILCNTCLMPKETTYNWALSS